MNGYDHMSTPSSDSGLGHLQVTASDIRVMGPFDTGLIAVSEIANCACTEEVHVPSRSCTFPTQLLRNNISLYGQFADFTS